MSDMNYSDRLVLLEALEKISDASLSLAHQVLEDVKQSRKGAASDKRFTLRRQAQQAQADFEKLCTTLGLAKNSPDGRITFKTALQYGYTYGEMHRLGWIAENDWSGYRRKRENE